MRSAIIISVLAGLVAASPLAKRQDIDFAGVDAGATPVPQGPSLGAANQTPTFNPSAAAASASADAGTAPVASASATGSPSRRDNYDLEGRKVDVNAPCSKQPPGSGPVTSPDTDIAFLANTAYGAIASNAPTPQGYGLIDGFVNLGASPYQNGYMGLYTLTSYDTIKCQELCDAAAGCVAFNMLIERDPSVAPAAACPDPTSTVNYRCTLYGLPISVATATQTGQYRTYFHVVIAGSNGYLKLAPPTPIDGFNGPNELGGAINAPSGYIGMKYYSGPYNPASCAAACLVTTAYNMKHAPAGGKYDACNFFNSYVLSINNVPQGTYCSMYTTAWDRSYSTNYGQFRGKDFYSNSQSYSYGLTTPDPGQV